MKKFFISFILLVAFVGYLNAQFKQGDFELGFTGTAGWQNYSSANNISMKYASLSLLPGYYVIDGLSIEPEIGMTFIERIKPAFFFVGNLSYTFLLPPRMPIGVFARIGYGVANSSHIPGEIFYSGGYLDTKSNIFNLGVGAKFLLDPKVYIRSEIIYRNINTKYKWEGDEFSEKSEFIVFLIGLGIVI